MSLLISHQQLRFAVHELVTSSLGIQQRLARVWLRQLEFLELEDAPGYMQKAMDAIRGEFTSTMSNERHLPTPTLSVPDEQAVGIGQRVLFLHDDLTQLATVGYQKHVISLVLSPGNSSLELKQHAPMGAPSETRSPSIPPPNSRQKLQLAIYALATGTNPVRERLFAAWRDHVDGVEVNDLPESLRSSFAEIKNSYWSYKNSVNGSIQGSPLFDDRARNLASRLLILYEYTAELSIIDHYKFTLRTSTPAN